MELVRSEALEIVICHLELEKWSGQLSSRLLQKVSDNRLVVAACRMERCIG